MPRETTTPVLYKDIIIPTGTMVFLNDWLAMMVRFPASRSHFQILINTEDTTLFAEFWSFIPERWPDESTKYAHQFAFVVDFEIHPAEDANENEWVAIKGGEGEAC
ncbi:hypothetical protein BJX63DRAFT_430112 [Aspergillus granulosus]|uniref:Uncharacterized protein n=1 Tax=Aspergillus granulosus TaxID=176169 RepID=A0ABR4HPV0_9EURO